MRIVQLLESETSKVYGQLSQLEGMDLKFLTWIFKQYRPKHWFIQEKTYSFRHLTEMLTMSGLLRELENNLLIFYNASKKGQGIVAMALHGRTNLGRDIFYDFTVRTLTNFKFGESSKYYSKQLFGDLLYTLEQDLYAGDEDQIIMWVGNITPLKFNHEHMTLASFERSVEDFFNKMHNYLWTRVKRQVRIEDSKLYKSFIKDIDPHVIELDPSNNSEIKNLWVSVTEDISEKIVTDIIPFRTAQDRKAALDMFVSEFMNELRYLFL